MTTLERIAHEQHLTILNQVRSITALTLDAAALATELRQVAQMIHQAYHQDVSGTWLECPRGVCERVRKALAGSIVAQQMRGPKEEKT